MTHRIKVGKKYQVTIPAEIRNQLQIKPGDRLLIDLRADSMLLIQNRLIPSNDCAVCIARFGKVSTHKSTFGKEDEHGRSNRHLVI